MDERGTKKRGAFLAPHDYGCDLPDNSVQGECSVLNDMGQFNLWLKGLWGRRTVVQ